MSSSSLRRKIFKKRRTLIVNAGLATLALAAGIVVTSAFVQSVDVPPVSDKVAEYYSNPPTPPAKAEVDLVAVIGDSYTGGSNMGGIELKNWVSLAQSTTGSSAKLVNHAVGGTGYITETDTFLARVPKAVRPETDMVVFFGSRNDEDKDAARVGQAAATAYTAALKIAPDARLLVIGPAWVNQDVPPNLLLIRDQLKSAAAAKGATFIDPLSEGWFFDRPQLIGSDGVHPTDAGHAFLAKKIGPHISASLALTRR